jgi:hydrogenase maturation protein HypF
VFQNRVLTERVQALLTAERFQVLIPKLLPVNDAGISYGQLIEAAAAHGAHT